MSEERNEKEDPAEQLKQGIGLLFRAARGAAATVKKDLDKSDFGRSLEDAGREFARAATNVVGRITEELNKQTGKHGGRSEERPPVGAPRDEARAANEDGDDFDGVKAPEKKPTGPTPQDPGFRIMVDDDDKKPR